MLRIIVTALAFLAVITPAASASRMPTPEGITVQHAACPFYTPTDGTVVSCADTNNGTLWLEPGAQVGGWTYWHELGHFFDAQVLDDRTRSWLTPRLGHEQGTPWWGSGVGADDGSPAEAFADAYALCAKGTRRERRSVRQVCNAITIAGLLR